MQGWNAELFEPLKAAGGRAFSNYAVGISNVDVEAGTANKIAVGNTPGGTLAACSQLRQQGVPCTQARKPVTSSGGRLFR